MINIVYKKGPIRINSIWYCNELPSCILKKSTSDVVFFHGLHDSILKTYSTQYTLITDLNKSLVEIMKNIKKNYKYEINRAEKEGVKCIVYNSKEIIQSVNILMNFKEEYNTFTKLKGIGNTYNVAAMNQYIENDNIILTKALLGDVVYAQHIYLCDGINSRLLYSVSNFRGTGLEPSTVARANKLLHWNDIRYLKEKGYNSLDWGGISNPQFNEDLLNGIDLFKIGFGGQEVKYYNCIQGINLQGKILVLLRNFKLWYAVIIDNKRLKLKEPTLT